MLFPCCMLKYQGKPANIEEDQRKAHFFLIYTHIQETFKYPGKPVNIEENQWKAHFFLIYVFPVLHRRKAHFFIISAIWANLGLSGPIWDEPSGTPPKGSWSSRDHFWSKWPLAETRKQPFLRQLQNGENELPELDPPVGVQKTLK